MASIGSDANDPNLAQELKVRPANSDSDHEVYPFPFLVDLVPNDTSSRPMTESYQQTQRSARSRLDHFKSPLVRYAFAIVSVALMTWLRMALSGVIGGTNVFITFYPAVVATAALCGAGPAALTILLSSLSATFYLLSPNYSLVIHDPDEAMALGLFVAVSASIAWMSERQRVARLAAERTVAALADSESRLATTLASIGDGVIATDKDGAITFINPMAEKLTGWPREQAVGKKIGEVFCIVSETTRALAPNPVERAIREGTIVGLANHTVLLAKDGTERPIDDSGAPIRTADGKIAGAVLVFRDVTERRGIERAIAGQQGEIEELNARLRRSMAETHHRVKNNLQVISALLELPMLDGAESIAASELVRMVQHVRSLGVIHDLLTQSSKETLGDDVLSASEIVRKLLPTLQAMAPGRKIRWHADDLSLPLSQSTSLTMLANELVSNAMKHGRGDIGLRLQADGPGAVLEVTDEGPGFGPDFDPRRSANTGVELIESLARWDLQGSTEYANKQEGGARVTIRFPLRTDVMPIRPAHIE